jgi:hypothetical protein
MCLSQVSQGTLPTEGFKRFNYRGRFTPGERPPGTHWIGGWADLRAGLDDLEKRKFLTLPGLELRPLGRPACS